MLFPLSDDEKRQQSPHQSRYCLLRSLRPSQNQQCIGQNPISGRITGTVSHTERNDVGFRRPTWKGYLGQWNFLGSWSLSFLSNTTWGWMFFLASLENSPIHSLSHSYSYEKEAIVAHFTDRNVFNSYLHIWKQFNLSLWYLNNPKIESLMLKISKRYFISPLPASNTMSV